MYSVLCRSYPPRFSARFGDEMRSVFADACRDAGRRANRSELARLTLDTLCDFVWSVVAEQLSERRRQVREWVGPVSQRPVRLAYLTVLGGVPLLTLLRVLLGPSMTMQHVEVMGGLTLHCAVMHVTASRLARRTVPGSCAARDRAVDDADCYVTRFSLRLTLVALVVVLALEPVSVVGRVHTLGATLLVNALWIGIPVTLVLGLFATVQPLLRIGIPRKAGARRDRQRAAILER
jgi:hypothetical protein